MAAGGCPDPLARMRASMAAFYRLLGERSPDGRAFERDGVVAAIAPSCPNRSVVNAVVYEHGDALAGVRDELQDAYEQAGVRAWTVWVPETDAAAGRLLQSAGHVRDARPRAMTLELAWADLDEGAGAIDWERTEDVAALAAINEQAYGLPSGEFARAMTAFTGSRAQLYLARADGDAAACVAALDAEGDCGIYMVATAPSAQRRGLGLGLMRQALSEARERGASTSSLQATRWGEPLYRRLGYRDHGAIDMWELRGG